MAAAGSRSVGSSVGPAPQWLLAVVVVLLTASSVMGGALRPDATLVTQTWAARELAAPAADILSGRLRLPVPSIHESRHAMIPVTATAEPDGTATGVMTFAHPGGRLAVAYAFPAVDAAQWTAQLITQDGRVGFDSAAHDPGRPAAGVSLQTGDLAAVMGIGASGSASPTINRLDLTDATAGTWTLVCHGPASGVGANGVVIVSTDEGPALRAHWQDLAFRAGFPAFLEIDADGTLLNVNAAVERVGAEQRALREASVRVNLSEDAGGSAAVVLIADTPGTYVVTVRANVRAWRDGSIALRSCELLVHVPEAGGRFAGAAVSAPLDAHRERIDLPLDAPAAGGVALVAAEVWSVDGQRETPVCWIANLCETGGPTAAASLVFDRRWLTLIGVHGGDIELRNLRLQQRDSFVVLDSLPRVPLGPVATPVLSGPRDDASLLRALTHGRAGGHPVASTIAPVSNVNDATAPGTHALVLVHGYCADGVTFPPEHFSGDRSVFLDPGAARSNNDFAQLILSHGAQHKSFGTVAHSQGGLASLHLHTFYWSGLAWAKTTAEGARLIQSVGSPYQGTPLAGNLAILGAIFGVGCGELFDLSVDGAALWLSTIPTWARQDVWYWTTQYFDGPGSFDWCDFVSDLFLSNPNDGVVERVAGQLPGGNDMGHKQGWCHTTGMDDPPQYNDQVRNMEMDANAAR